MLPWPFNPNDEHSRTTHGQYHLWQCRSDGSRARDAARHQDQSRRLLPREGCRSRLADRLAHWPAAQSGSGSERCSKDSQNSGLFSHGAARRGRAKPSFISMTICRAFAARRQRASVGLHPRRWPVIGSFATAGLNAAGTPKPTAMRHSATSTITNGGRRAVSPGLNGVARASLGLPFNGGRGVLPSNCE